MKTLSQDSTGPERCGCHKEFGIQLLFSFDVKPDFPACGKRRKTTVLERKTSEGKSRLARQNVLFVHTNRSRDPLDGRPGASVQFVHSSSAIVRRHAEECAAHVDKPPHLYHMPNASQRSNALPCNHREMIGEGNFSANKR